MAQQQGKTGDLAQLFDAMVEGDARAFTPLGNVLGAQPESSDRDLARQFDELLESEREPGWAEWAIRNFGSPSSTGVVQNEFARGALETAGQLARAPGAAVRQGVDLLELLGVSKERREELGALANSAFNTGVWTAAGQGMGAAAKAIPSDPRYGDSFLGDAARAAGSAAVYAVPALASGPAAPFVAGSMGVAGESTGLRERAEEDEDSTASQRTLMTLAGVPLGALESFGAEQVLGALGKQIAKRIGRKAVDELGVAVTERVLRTAILSGAAEGSEEVLQGIGEDVATKVIVDPEQRIEIARALIDQGLPAAVVGTIMGGGARFGEEALARDQQQRQQAEQRMQEAATRVKPEEAERFRDLAAATEAKLGGELSFVDQLTPEEAAVRELGKRLGLEVAFFDAANVTAPAAHSGGRVLINRRAGAGRARALLLHEAIHGLRRHWSPELYAELQKAAQELLGPEWEQSSALYAADLRARGEEIEAGLTPEGTPLEEEATARLVERLAPIIDTALTVPRGTEVLARAIAAEPSLLEGLLDAVKRLLNKLPGVQLELSYEQRLRELAQRFQKDGVPESVPIREAIQYALLFKETFDQLAGQIEAAFAKRQQQGDQQQLEAAGQTDVQGQVAAARATIENVPEAYRPQVKAELQALGFSDEQVARMSPDEAFDAIEYGQGLRQIDRQRRSSEDAQERAMGSQARSERDYDAEANRARDEAWGRYAAMRKATAPDVGGEPRPYLAPKEQRSPFLMEKIEDIEYRGESVPRAVHPLFYASADELARMAKVVEAAERQAAEQAFEGKGTAWAAQYLELKRQARDYDNPERGRAATILRRIEAQLTDAQRKVLDRMRTERAPGLPFTGEEIADAQKVRREVGFGRGGEKSFKDVGAGPQFAVGRPGSDEFAKWFGDSKVVDAAGRPLVVYHGTNQPLRSFDRERGGAVTRNRAAELGHFFTDSPQVAAEYAASAGRMVVADVVEHERKVAAARKLVDDLTRKAQRTRSDEDWSAQERAMEAWEKLELDAMREDEIAGQNLVPAYLSIQNPFVVEANGRQASVGEISAVVERARAAGHDGVIWRDLVDPTMPADHFAVFDSKQVRSAVSGVQFARMQQLSFVEQRAPGINQLGFYSQLERVIEEKMPRRASAQQVLGILKGAQVKQDELEWSGVREWLAQQKEPVSKDAVLDFVRGNGLKLRETLRVEGDRQHEASRDYDRELHAARHDLWHSRDALQQHLTLERWGTPQEVLDQVNKLATAPDVARFRVWALPGATWATARQLAARMENDVHRVEIINSARHAAVTHAVQTYPESASFKDYTLKGGEHYREWLLQATPKNAMDLDEFGVEYRRTFNSAATDEEVGRAFARQRPLREVHAPSGHFTGGHFDQPDVLVHVRTKDRVDEDGDSMLFIEEVQSDWNLATRKDKHPAVREWWIVRDAASGKYIGGVGTRESAETLAAQHGEDRSVISYQPRVAGGTAPNSPMPKTEAWVGLAIKRMVLAAVNEGFAAIGWTTGEQQNDRYDLRKYVREIQWVPDDPTEPYGPGEIKGIDQEGEDAVEHSLHRPSVEKFAEVIGQGPAEALMRAVENAEWPSAFDEESEFKYFAEQYQVEPITNHPELLAEVWNNLNPGEEMPEDYDPGTYVILRDREVIEDEIYDSVRKAELAVDSMVESDVQDSRDNFSPDGGEDRATIEDADLVIGGDWAETLYDNVLVNVANKLGKKFGAQVGNSNIMAANTDERHLDEMTVWKLPITPELRQSALTEGFAQFAVQRPTPDQLRDVAAATKVAAREGERTDVGSRPNPIANTRAEADLRAAQRGAREVWSQGFEPVTRAAQLERAKAALADDYEGEKRRLFEKARNGETPAPHEQLELDLIKQRETETFLADAKPDEQKFADAVEASWIYQEARAQAARALGVIRDAYQGMRTGAQRFSDLVTQLSPDLRRRIERLKEERKTPTISDERRAQIDRQIKQLLGVEARRVHSARAKLIEAGLNPKFIPQEFFKDPLTYARMARIVSSAKSGRWDWFLEYYLASILSFPLTHVRNITGNAVNTIADQHLKRVAEALVNTVVREPNATTGAELAEFYGSWLPGLVQAGRNFMLSMRTELPIFEWDLQSRGLDLEGYGTKIDTLRGPAIGGTLGRAIRYPSLTLLQAADEFFKTLAAWTEGHALAFRQAKSEGLEGPARRARMDEILNGPPNEVHLRSLVTAKQLAFQGKGGPITSALMQMRQAINDRTPGQFPLASVLFPFVQTPIRIFEQAVGLPGHPLRTVWRALSGRYTGENADKPQLVEDLARSAVGLAVIAGALALVLGDDDDELPVITGIATNADERALMFRTAPELSIKVGSNYYSYANVEPAATSVGLLVTAAREFKRASAQGNVDGILAALAKLGQSVPAMLAQKTFLETFGELYKIVTEEGGFDQKAARFVLNTMFLPMVPNLIRGTARSSDELLRANTVRKYDDAGTWSSAVRSAPYYAFPVADNAPPPRFDLWGRPVERPGSWIGSRILGPTPQVQTVEQVSDLDRLLVRYNERVARGEIEEPDAEKVFPRAPNYWFTYRGKTYYLSDDEYARLSQEAGQSAAAALLKRGKRFTWQTPTTADVDEINRELSDARDKVRRQIIRERERRGEL